MPPRASFGPAQRRVPGEPETAIDLRGPFPDARGHREIPAPGKSLNRLKDSLTRSLPGGQALSIHGLWGWPSPPRKTPRSAGPWRFQPAKALNAHACFRALPWERHADFWMPFAPIQKRSKLVCLCKSRRQARGRPGQILTFGMEALCFEGLSRSWLKDPATAALVESGPRGPGLPMPVFEPWHESAAPCGPRRAFCDHPKAA